MISSNRAGGIPDDRKWAGGSTPECRYLIVHQAIRNGQDTVSSNKILEYAMTLAQRNATEALPELRWLLENRNAARRAIGILALSKMRDRKAIPTLVRLIEDPVFAVPTPLARWHADYPSPRVWHFAVDGLERITGTKTEGRTVADRRAFWRQWYGENR